MQAGLPLIVSDTGQMALTVAEAEAGAVVPVTDADTIGSRKFNVSTELGILDLTQRDGMNPATGKLWAGGDTFRLAFVSMPTNTATSDDITTYNAFIQGVAAGSSTFPTLRQKPKAWYGNGILSGSS